MRQPSTRAPAATGPALTARIAPARRLISAALRAAGIGVLGTLLPLASSATWAADPRPVHTERVSIRSNGELGAGNALATPSTPLPVADRIVVRKSLRRMFLMRGETVLRTYKIALGLNPIGQKERSGDFRTPEGRYLLTRRNPRSDYFLSIQVSYPNESDLARARRHRWDAGGSIMIHGLPNHLRRPPEYYEKYDWTDGCIAVSDSDMVEIWLMTGERTPIDILP